MHTRGLYEEISGFAGDLKVQFFFIGLVCRSWCQWFAVDKITAEAQMVTSVPRVTAVLDATSAKEGRSNVVTALVERGFPCQVKVEEIAPFEEMEESLWYRCTRETPPCALP